MRSLGVRLMACAFCFAAGLCSLSAQQATVSRNLRLRSDASTSKPPIETLQKGSKYER